MHRSIHVPALLLLILLLATGTGSARAQCSYVTLGNDVPVATAAASTFYTFTGLTGYWGAIAVRPDAGSNHDLAVFSNTAGSPTCVTGQVGSSAVASGVDFVVGDFRVGRNATGPWYGKATRVMGAGSGVAQLDRGGEELIVDNDPIVRNTARVIDVYQIFLEANVSYIVDFRPSPGVDAKVLIFRNPTASAYWAGRSQNLLESSGITNFTATANELYCLVVVNDDGGVSNYSLAVEQCQPPIALLSNTPASTSPPLRYRMDQSQPYWSALGVRGAGADNWDVTTYKTGRGALEPVCFKDSTAASNSAGSLVDLVVGDFTYNPLAPYFGRVNRVSGSQVGVVEWDGGPEELLVNDPPAQRSTGPGDVLEIWDAYLNAATPYSIYFERTGAANTSFLLFANTIQNGLIPYWAGRSGAVLTGQAHASFTPTVTGYHAIAVVNDDGGVGTYRVGVYGGAVGIAPGGPTRATLDALSPNPAFGRTTIAYSLPRAGRVSFDVLDVGGRLVTRGPALEAQAGPGRFTWDARAAGARTPPGVYFVRMMFAGRQVGLQKLVFLP